ncbi:hypothetical protein G6F68_012491 [Rhizopus microsporus]|nr:hypothetical protein G6F68_012491 [Rhizopus microsporus]
MHFLDVAGFLALAPQALARTRPVHRAAGGGGFGKRFAVHPGHHHDLAVFKVLRDGGNQAVFVENDVGHPAFAFANGVLAEMEDAGGQHGAGAAGGDAVGQMLQVADAAGGDDGYRHGIRHGAGQLQVEARLGAVAVHAGQEDLARAIGSHAARPGHGVQPGGLAAAGREDFPARGLAGRRHAARVDGHDHALRAMVVGGSADHRRWMSDTWRTPPPTVSLFHAPGKRNAVLS